MMRHLSDLFGGVWCNVTEIAASDMDTCPPCCSCAYLYHHSCCAFEHLTALQATREKLEPASAAALAAPPAQGRLELIADRVKHRSFFCVVIPAVHFNVCVSWYA